MTRRCCWCKAPHIMGSDLGAPYTDGMCWKAELREDVKWYAPIVGRFVENSVLVVALIYISAQLVRWWLNGFKI